MEKEIKRLYCVDKNTITQIANILGINRKQVSKIIHKLELTQDPPKNDLIKLYNEEMLTIKQIQNIYGVGKKKVNSWFKKYNIPKISNAERKYYLIRKVPLSKIQREFVIGTLLGDGCLSSSGKFKRLRMGHSIKQLDYLLWKKSIMSNLTNVMYRQIQHNRNSILLHCSTVGHQDFNFFYKLFYDNNKKVIKPDIEFYLTPFSMAVWFMDDGSCKPYSMKLSTEGFSRKENETLQKSIFVKFNIRCKVCEYSSHGKKYNYLSFNKKNSIKLCELIQEYVINSMKYKLPFLND